MLLILRDVLQLAWDRGFRKVICDVDCVELVKVIADVEAMQLHTEFLVLNYIRQLMTKEWDVKRNGVHRDSNVVADCLARRGVVACSHGSWVIDSTDSDV